MNRIVSSIKFQVSGLSHSFFYLNNCCMILISAMILVTSLISCASDKTLRVESFHGFSDIKEGDSATIAWSFINADYIKVNDKNHFGPIDSLKVSPEKSTKYSVTAFNAQSDSLALIWRVFVNKDSQSVARKGPDILHPSELKPSYEYSEYLTGMNKPDAVNNPVALKVMRTIYPTPEQSSNPNCLLRCIILDENGNYLPGNMNPEMFSAVNSCKIGTNNVKIEKILEKLYNTSAAGEQSRNICISLDNSSDAENNSQVIDYIKEFSTNLEQSDELMFSYFNQNYTKAISLTSAEKSSWDLKNIQLPRPSGLNAMYKAAFKSLVELASKKNNKQPLFIMILFGSDNASLIYDSKDVTEIANEFGIPIYIIGVGNAIQSYNLKYLSAATGGRYYFLGEEDVSSIKAILKEILISQKNYYEIELPIADYHDKCTVVKSEINFTKDNKTVKDAVQLIFKPQVQFPKMQAVVAFDDKSSNIDSAYNENISSLAKILKENPAYSILLIGNTGLESDESSNIVLSLERVEAVKEKLLSEGVTSDQLRIRAEGSNTPVYYLQNTGWQQYCNRRVEVRWLDPEQLPFEIIAEQIWTEDEATQKVEAWENRGLNSYYQRYMNNEQPFYKVKLWGYKTYEDAEDNAKKLEKKFKIPLAVE